MPINTIVGQVASGDDFYSRPKLIEDLWNRFESGSNILLSAPRRVGKSSLLKFIEDNPEENYHIINIITQSVNNENEFFRKLYMHVYELLNTKDKFIEKFKNIIGQKGVTEITKDGIKLESKVLSYYDSLVKIFEKLELGNDKIIIMIDEYAETIENIIKDEEKEEQGRKKAINFLQKNRELRHLSFLKNKVQFVYAGSIGLENVVSRLDFTSSINDLYSFKLPPLTEKEANELVYIKILNGCEMSFDTEQFKYLLSKIEWYIPFYFQLALDEIYRLYHYEEQKEITNNVIDKALNNAIEHRGYFEPWSDRLRKAFKGKEYNFIKEVLNAASQSVILSSSEVYDKAVQWEVTENYKSIINSLIYDGYINNSDDPKEYRFNSPILKMWWYKYVAN